MIWYWNFVTAILIQKTGGLKLASTSTLVLQAKQLTKCASHLQFSCYNPIKTSFLAVAIAPAPLFSLYTLCIPNVMLILILSNIQHLQKVVGSLEKVSNGQNHSSSGSNHPIKNSPSPKKICNCPSPPPPPTQCTHTRTHVSTHTHTHARTHTHTHTGGGIFLSIKFEKLISIH